jgi:hypothetical protein
MIEVMEEEELANMRAHQEQFIQMRAAEIAEAQRMEEAERRRYEEKERRAAQVWRRSPAPFLRAQPSPRAHKSRLACFCLAAFEQRTVGWPLRLPPCDIG